MDLALISSIALMVGSLGLETVLIHLVAKAAQRKGRSYQSFFWLATVFRAMFIWPIVASFPFLPGDPASPVKDNKPEENPQRYVNPALAEPLVTRNVLAALIGSGLVVVISAIAVAGIAITSLTGQITHLTSAVSGLFNNVSSLNSLTSGLTDSTTKTTDTAATNENCDRMLLGADISQGYTAGSSCLAWRWTVKTEQASLHCDKFAWCTFAGVYALSSCKAPTLVASFKDASGTILGSDVSVGEDLPSGGKENIEIGSTKFKTWQSAVITSTYCGA